MSTSDDYDPDASAMDLQEARRHRAVELAIQFFEGTSPSSGEFMALCMSLDRFLGGTWLSEGGSLQ